MSETEKKHKAQAPSNLSFGVFTCSTSRHRQIERGESIQDVSGDLIVSLLESVGHRVVLRRLIPDDRSLISKSLDEVLTSTDLDAAIFTGGTGISGSDVTIETVTPFLDRVLPGFGEIFRRLSYDEIGSAALMSRALAGVAKGKAFFCIPGSPNAVRLCMEKLILPETAHIVKHSRE